MGRAQPVYLEDERFKLLHDVYQSKTRSTSRTRPPALESPEDIPAPGDGARFGLQSESLLQWKVDHTLPSPCGHSVLCAFHLKCLAYSVTGCTLFENCKRATTECDLGGRESDDVTDSSPLLPTSAHSDICLKNKTVARYF